MDKLSVLYEMGNLLKGLQRYLWMGGLVLALLNCFFGYRLRKLWGVFFGFFLGVGGGLALASHQQYSNKLAICLALGLGFFLALLAFLLYRLGLFFLCGGLTGFFLWKLIPTHNKTTLAFCILAGCCIGIFALFKERFTVSLATSLGGAWASAWFFCQLWGLTHPLILILITILLAGLGLLVQFKPWRDRDKWDFKEEEEKEREYQRKKRRKEKRIAQRRARKREKRQSKRQSKRRRKASKGHKDKRQSACKGNRTQASDGSSRPRAASSSPAASPSPADSAGSSSASPDPQANRIGRQSDRPEAQTDRPQAQTDQPEAQSGLPDLADIRAHLSQEVSAIYQENQSSRD